MLELEELWMDLRGNPRWQFLDKYRADVGVISGHSAAVLAAATRLHSLELRIRWSGGLAALCGALPALVDLK